MSPVFPAAVREDRSRTWSLTRVFRVKVQAALTTEPPVRALAARTVEPPARVPEAPTADIPATGAVHRLDRPQADIHQYYNLFLREQAAVSGRLLLLGLFHGLFQSMFLAMPAEVAKKGNTES